MIPASYRHLASGVVTSHASQSLEDAVPFLARVDTNHDFQVSRRELSRFIAASVDLNHDRKISIYEETLLQIHDPQAARFLFPGS